MIQGMKLFEELLESYDLLKKRKFRIRLVEEVDELAAQTALSELQAAVQQKGQITGRQPYVPPTASTPVALFYNRKGQLSFAPLARDGLPIVRFSKHLDEAAPQTGQWWNTFVGFFGGDSKDVEGGPEEEKDDISARMGFTPPVTLRAPAGQTLLASQYGQLYGDDILDAVDAFQELELISKEVHGNYLDEFKVNSTFETPRAFDNFLFGAKGQSLESKISRAINIEVDEFGQISEQLGVVDPDIINEVSKNILRLGKLLSKPDMTDQDKLDFASLASINSDGTVSVFAYGTKNEGLNFKDNKNFFKGLIRSIEERANTRVDRLNMRKTAFNTSDNAFRGVNMEEILVAISLQKRCLEARATGDPAAEVICPGAAQALAQFQDQMARMIQAHKVWQDSWNVGALAIEDVDVVNAISELIGDNMRQTFGAIIGASKDSLNIRKPDFVVPRGRETGFGIRGDVFEIWTDPDEAKLALQRSGFSEEDIINHDMIEPMSVQDAFGGREDLANIAIRSTGLNPNSMVFVNKVSLKNYLELDSPKLGEASTGQLNNWLTNTHPPHLQENASKFLKVFQDSYALSPQDMNEIGDYSSEMFELGNSIRALSTKTKVKTQGDKVVISDTLETLVKATKNLLTKNNTFKEINSDNNKKELLNLLGSYKNDSPKLFKEKLKRTLEHHVQMKKLIRDLNNGNESARKYLLARAFFTGGSVDDGLSIDMRSLLTKERFNLRHNEVVNSVLTSWFNRDGNWKMRTNGGTIAFINTADPKQRMSLSATGKKSKAAEAAYTTQMRLSVSKETFRAFLKATSIGESLSQSDIQFLKRLQKTMSNRSLVVL
jgi:hypothetical protein